MDQVQNSQRQADKIAGWIKQYDRVRIMTPSNGNHVINHSK